MQVEVGAARRSASGAMPSLLFDQVADCQGEAIMPDLERYYEERVGLRYEELCPDCGMDVHSCACYQEADSDNDEPFL